ncbi:death-associated inhibitor of apoptosis 2-like [Neocloeon triangulifer]|uniref:death-associated inhibitor of apoptosis 2-like n=1 Tax=Neocloeon triangulifer TaxID=2078957 RepID=UPI00286F6318|nr:death-associated inhibitor of apoptosis 2-like [Neocloeon triangulifer]
MSEEEDPLESLPDSQSPVPGPSSGISGSEMNYEKRRLETFQSWPANAAVEPRKIAKAGFFYTGNELEVRCFSCNRTLSEWDYDDQVMVKHRALSPECPFVVSPLECGNVPILRRESSGFAQAQVDYRIESERLASYRGWSSPHVTPEALARNGLYYLREGDKVACAFCSVQMFNWKAGDNPLIEHRNFSPNCPLLMGYLVGNVSLDHTGSGTLIDHGEEDDNYEIVSTSSSDEGSDEYGIRENSRPIVIQPFSGPDDLTGANPDNVELANNPRYGAVAHRPPIHPRYQTVQSRLATFSDWRRQTPSAESLAAAGFFYQGMNDHCSCFHCNGGLHNWDPNDDPWVEHARWFSKCPYVNIVKGQDYIKDVVKNKPPIIPVVDLHLNDEGEVNGEANNENEAENPAQNGQAQCEEAEEAAAIAAETLPPTDETESKKLEDEKTRSEGPDKEDTSNNPKEVAGPKEKESEGPSASEAHLCKVCLDEDVGVVFLPCGHLVSCVQCAPNLSLCPVCRKEIQASVRTYFS